MQEPSLATAIWPIPILWDDDALLVVNKPAGLPTLPDGYDPAAPCLVRLLQERHGRLWVVHRLDRPTSGVLVLARHAAAHRALNLQFDRREVHKVYHALVVGAPAWEERTVDLPLCADGDRRHRTVVDRVRGKPASTHFRVLRRGAGCALVAAQPQTGRTHQIRAHLAALGQPLAGDELYGGLSARLLAPGSPEQPLIGRPALHAWSLTLRHPVNSTEVICQAPYSADFAAALQLACGGAESILPVTDKTGLPSD
jgi:RluA family pseudouridine synthase